MASGLGINGTVGRCFYHFQDFAVCMKKEDDPVNNCVGLRDDYIECLHGFKQVVININVDSFITLPIYCRNLKVFSISCY